MVLAPQSQFSGFTSDVLGALLVPGIAERWAAVQAQLHPQLVALAEALRDAGVRRFPREWPLYEFSFRSLRYVNHAGGRAPIDDYHMGVDRPPRGKGVYIVVSGAEQLIIIALQLSTRQRKADLRRAWEQGRTLWLPLVERVNDVRFAESRKTKNEKRKTKEVADHPLRANTRFAPTPLHPFTETWMDRYLASRDAAYLLAGFAYTWGDA